MANTIITVNDSITHNPVIGANVFVNGVGQGTTNSSGQILLTTVAISFTLSITANNYTTYTSTVTAGTAVPIFLAANASPDTVSFIVNINPDAVAIGTILTFDNDGSPITATYAAGGITVLGLTPGVQTITGSISGYNDINQSINTTAQQNTIELFAADNGLAQQTQQQATQDPNISLLIPPAHTTTNPEFVAPNTGQGTYFTMTQARLYIGNLFIDELSNIQFVLQDNQIPVYGYASRYYDALAQGKSLVQGQLAINFISEGYLYTTLKAYSTFITQGNQPAVTPATGQQQDRLTTLAKAMQNSSLGWTPLTFAAAQKEVNTLAASLGPAAVTSTNSIVKTAAAQQQNNLLGLAGGDYPNAIYSNITFDIVLEFAGAGRKVTRRLEGCRLISNECVLDHSGTPVLDSYGFIARRLR